MHNNVLPSNKSTSTSPISPSDALPLSHSPPIDISSSSCVQSAVFFEGLHLQCRRIKFTSSNVCMRPQVNGAAVSSFPAISSRSNPTRLAEWAWEALKCRLEWTLDAWMSSCLSMSLEVLIAYSKTIDQQTHRRELRITWVPWGDFIGATEALYSVLFLSM